MSTWMFPKIGVPPKSSIFNRVFHYFHHPFWDTPIFGKIHVASQTVSMTAQNRKSHRNHIAAGAAFLDKARFLHHNGKGMKPISHALEVRVPTEVVVKSSLNFTCFEKASSIGPVQLHEACLGKKREHLTTPSFIWQGNLTPKKRKPSSQKIASTVRLGPRTLHSINGLGALGDTKG